MGKSGGGNAGAISYPTYMQTQHEDWLDDAEALIDPYITGDSPYEGESAYDPSTLVAEMKTQFDEFDTFLDARNNVTDWQAAITAAQAKLSSLFPDPSDSVQTMGGKAKVDASGAADDALTGAITGATSLQSAADAAIQADVSDVIDDAIGKILSDTVDNLIDDIVEDYEEASKGTLYKSLNRFAGGMVDINAVHSSAFVIGTAIIERDFRRDVDGYRAKVKLQLSDRVMSEYLNTYRAMMGLYVQTGVAQSGAEIAAFSSAYKDYLASFVQNQKNRSIFTVQSANEMSRLLTSNVEFERQAASLLREIDSTRIMAKKEQIDRDLEIDVNDAKWPFDVLLQGGNVLASVSGAAHTITHPMGATQSALSGAAAGASIGASFGGYGAAIGAGAGFILGLL